MAAVAARHRSDMQTEVEERKEEEGKETVRRGNRSLTV